MKTNKIEKYWILNKKIIEKGRKREIRVSDRRKEKIEKGEMKGEGRKGGKRSKYGEG